MIKNELQMLRKNKLLLLVLAAIILIPSIYAGIFLSSMWDPYGDLGKLPVAVVNLDQPVKYHGKELAIGDKLTESLEQNKSMSFIQRENTAAQEGLKDGTYYMVITIPEDFSKNATTLTKKSPKKMVLNYDTNPGKNYISMKLSESAMKEIKSNVTAEVTRTYAKTVFSQLSDIGDGFQAAADGTLTMAEGENKLLAGSAAVRDNLKTLSDSTTRFQTGAETLRQGTVAYTDGVSQLNEGLTKLQKGSGTLVSRVSELQKGSGQLLNGLTTMKDSIDKSLTEKNIKDMKKAETGLLTFNTNMQQLNRAVNGDGQDTKPIDVEGINNALGSVGGNIQTAGTNLNSAAGTLTGAYAQTRNQSDLGGCAGDVMQAYMTLAALLQSDPTLTPAQQQTIKSAMDTLVSQQNPTDINTAMGKALTATGTIGAAGTELKTAGGTLTELSKNNLSESVNRLQGSVAALAEASDQLLPASSKAITSLREGMEQVQYGLGKTESKDGSSGLIEGTSRLNAGIATLQTGIAGTGGFREGIAQLQDGSKQLVKNSEALVSGTAQLSTGAGQIAEGANRLADGSDALYTGLSDLQNGTWVLNRSLQDGADTISNTKTNDKTLNMFSKPVTLKENRITEVKNNGHAMAAYMMSVGLWVGCLAFCLMYPLTRYEGTLKNGLAWWSSKAVVAYPAAVLMAAALMVILPMANGFAPKDVGRTFAVASVAALSFMSIMYFFNVLLGKVGSFLMLIFMVLQLAGSAGTYPIEISGNLAKALHPYVPFTYSVNAFRSAIAGGQGVYNECVVLIILAMIFTILTIGVFRYRAQRLKEEKPMMYGWLEKNRLA